MVIAKLAPPMVDEMTPPPIPADEEERLAALTALNLLDMEAEPVFDRITAKLARVFEVSVALQEYANEVMEEIAKRASQLRGGEALAVAGS